MAGVVLHDGPPLFVSKSVLVVCLHPFCKPPMEILHGDAMGSASDIFSLKF